MGGGKGGGKQTVGYKYYLGMHLVLAHGPLDRLLRIRIGGKTAWSGSSTGGRINIDKPGLFGGESREGGVVGALDYAAGGPDQTANDYLAARLGSTRLPAFRGVAACVLRQMYIGMNPYLKNWEFRAQRVYTQPDGGPQWYEQTAAIGQFSDMALYLALDVSGSMGGIRLNTAKLALSIALDELASHADAHVFDVMVVAWSSSSSAILRRNVTAEDLADIKSWINSLTASGGTDFREAVAAAPEFFAGAGHKPRTVVFITDGIPDAGTVEPARDTLFSVAGVRSYGINIVLADTTSTARMDNTPEDGIPVVSETDPTPLRDAIMNGLVVHVDMNPAHIIRECLTSRDWGMGHPEADIEDTSFRAAADTLYDEGMGLSLLWDRQQPLEEFVQVVLDHIDGHLFVEPTTGLWTLRLVRDDYDAETLLTFNQSNVERVDNVSRPAFGELVNSVTVQFWNYETGQDDSITVQDIALAQMQGAEINTTVQYPGVTNGNLASRAASRDLRSLSAPLLSCTLYTYRDAEDLRQGDPFRLVWPDYGIDETIMRVTEIAYGDGRSHAIRIKAVQDVFALPSASFTTPADSEWTPPDSNPYPVPAQTAFELPYYELVKRFGEHVTSAAMEDAPELGYLGVAAPAPEGNAINARIATDAGAGFEEAGALDFCPTAVTTADIGPGESVVPIGGGDRLDLVTIGTHAQLGDELVAVESLTDTEMTIGRAVLDTVPSRHPAGTQIFFWDGYVESDDAEYVDGDVVDVKVLPVAGGGQLELEDATASTVIMDQRALRPYPPGNVTINGEYFPQIVQGAVTVAWAHRNRLQQTTPALLDFLAPSVTPEPGVTYSIVVRRADTNDLVMSEAGLTGEAAEIGVIPSSGTLRLQLSAERDGITSLYPYTHEFEYPTGFYGGVLRERYDSDWSAGTRTDLIYADDKLLFAGDALTGHRVSPAYDMTDAGIYGSSRITWAETLGPNRVPIGDRDFSGFEAVDGAVITLTQGQSVPEWETTSATRIQTTGGASLAKLQYTVEPSAPAGIPVRQRVYIQNLGTQSMYFSLNLPELPTTERAAQQWVAPGEIVLADIDGVGDGSADVQLQFGAASIEHDIDIYAWAPESVGYADVKVDVSLDSGDWVEVQSGDPIPGLAEGTSLSGKTLRLRQRLERYGPDYFTELDEVEIVIQPVPGVVPVRSPADLLRISEDPYGHYQLANDIDMSGVDWPGIGDFFGVLDGDGFVLRNFAPYWDGIAKRTGGLFSRLYGTVRRLGFEDLYLDGDASSGYTAGLAVNPRAGCLVEDVYAIGHIAKARQAGGLFGWYDTAAPITIRRTWAAVTIAQIGDNKGPHSGWFDGGSGHAFAANYLDSTLTSIRGQNETQIVSARTTAQLQTQSTFLGYDFDSIWSIAPGEYPKLRHR